MDEEEDYLNDSVLSSIPMPSPPKKIIIESSSQSQQSQQSGQSQTDVNGSQAKTDDELKVKKVIYD